MSQEVLGDGVSKERQQAELQVRGWRARERDGGESRQNTRTKVRSAPWGQECSLGLGNPGLDFEGG